MNNKKKQELNKSNYTNNRRLRNLPILLFMGIYFILAVIVMILFAPYAIDALGYMFIHIQPETAIAIFAAALIVALFSMTMFITTYIKNRTINLSDEHIDTSLYGIYDEERRYLEKKIDELTIRLIDTEEKWKDINHLILTGNDKNINNKGQVSSDAFLKEFGIDVKNIQVEKDLVFVLTPSDFEFVNDYLVVKTTCKKNKLRALRGDEEDLNYTNKNILGHILNYIIKSRIVIANISNRNPNVYYELGIAHMLGKPSILICRQGMDVPFDLQQKYIIFYTSEEDLSIKLTDALLNILTIE